jgi:1,4-dihydroxy-2-naphthoate octaprenyltransferase
MKKWFQWLRNRTLAIAIPAVLIGILIIVLAQNGKSVIWASF